MNILKVNKVLSHLTIIFAGMFLVFFIIDRINPAMEFISSQISKWVLLMFVISALLQGITTLMDIRYREKAAIARRGRGKRHINASRTALRRPPNNNDFL